LFYLETTCKN